MLAKPVIVYAGEVLTVNLIVICVLLYCKLRKSSKSKPSKANNPSQSTVQDVKSGLYSAAQPEDIDDTGINSMLVCKVQLVDEEKATLDDPLK
jgi:hypothetical protein